MTIDPSLLSGLLLVAETAINKALCYDPASRQQLSDLTDVLALKFTDPELTVYCCGDGDRVRLMCYCEQPVSTSLQGSPQALLTLLRQALLQPSLTLANSEVDLVGSTALLQQWQQLLQQLDIDWEDALNDVAGDIASPLIAQVVRTHVAWLRQQQQQHRHSIKNYLEEEIRLLPSRAEYEDLARQLDNIVLGVDRAAARVERLTRILAKDPADTIDTGDNPT